MKKSISTKINKRISNIKKTRRASARAKLQDSAPKNKVRNSNKTISSKNRGMSFANLGWDENLPEMWEAINHNKGDSKVVQLGGNINNGEQARFYDGNPKSWAPDIHPNGIEPSSLVAVIDYDGNNKELEVTYRDGFTAEYENISPDKVQEFAKSDSKGRWALKNLWNLPYN